MKRTKMSVATDILLEQMQKINNMGGKTFKDKSELRQAIVTSKTLNGSASNIIKESAITLAMEQYAHSTNIDVDTVVDRLGISYDKK